MFTKMEKLEKKVDNLLESLEKDQSVFVMCNNDDADFFYAYNSASPEVAAGIATIVSDWYDDGKKKSKRAAIGIVAAIRAIVANGGEAGIVIAKAVADGMTDSLMKKFEKNDDEDDGDKDTDEKCDDCNLKCSCRLPQAVEYRKANGIPEPKGRKKNSSCDKN